MTRTQAQVKLCCRLMQLARMTAFTPVRVTASFLVVEASIVMKSLLFFKM